MDKYEHIFHHAPIGIWEEDWSLLIEKLNSLRDIVPESSIRAYLDENPDYVHELASSVKIIRINKEIKKMYKLEDEKEMYDLTQTFTPESYNVFKDEMVAFYNNEPEFETEMFSIAKDGSIICSLIHIKFPLTGSLSIPLEYNPNTTIIVIMHDVTKDRLNYQKYVENKNKFHAAFVDGIIGMAITDLNGNILETNQIMSDFTEYSKEDLLKMNMSTLTQNYMDVNDNPDINFINMTSLKRSSSQTKKCQYECQIETKNGILKWTMIGINLLMDDDKIPLCFIWQIIDIDSEKQKSIMLKENNEKYVKLLNYTQAMFVILNDKGDIIDYSEKFMEMLSIHSDGKNNHKKFKNEFTTNKIIKGQSFRSMIHLEYIEKFDKALVQMQYGKPIQCIEILLTTKGEPKWVSINGNTIKNGGDKTYLLISDITESKIKSLAKMVEKEKKKDLLIKQANELRQIINKQKEL